MAIGPEMDHRRYSRERNDVDLVDGDDTHVLAALSVPPGSRVLDLGAADGSVARILRERGCRVWAVELDKAAAEKAREHCEDVAVLDLERADLSDVFAWADFDVVLLLDVLEHLRDPVATLRQVAVGMVPEARVLISLPNVTHGAVRLQLLDGSFSYTPTGLLDETHVRFFDRARAEALVDEAGLAVVEQLRVRRGITETEIPVDLSKYPEEVLRPIQDDVDSETFQFFFVTARADRVETGRAVPSLSQQLQARLEREQEKVRILTTAVEELRIELEHQVGRLAETEAHRVELIEQTRDFEGRIARVTAERAALADDVWMVRKELEVRDANMGEMTARLEAAVMAEREALRRADDAMADKRQLQAVLGSRDVEIARLGLVEAELAAVKSRAGYRLLEAACASLGRVPGVRWLVRLAAGASRR